MLLLFVMLLQLVVSKVSKLYDRSTCKNLTLNLHFTKWGVIYVIFMLQLRMFVNT